MVYKHGEDRDGMSPLTEIDELEEEDPTVEYRITRQLRAPRNTQYSTGSLINMIQMGEIDLDADYQRDIVWLSDRQQGLIDSIMRNYYIPPLLFTLTQGKDEDEIRRCVDGKQRLTSIKLFMEGKIPYVDPDTKVRYWYGNKGSSKSRKNYLPGKLQLSFANKQMACVEYDGLTDFQEREVFQRVQKAVQLTAGERHQAMSTPVAKFCHRLMDKFFKCPGSFKENDYFKLHLPRYEEFDHILRLAWTATRVATKSLNSTEIQTTQKLEDWLSDYVNTVPDAVQSRLERSLSVYLAFIFHPNYHFAFQCKKFISPIEFHAIGILIYQHMDSLSVAEIAKGIIELRKQIGRYESKRFRKDLLQLSYDYIAKMPPSKGGTVISRDPTTLQLMESCQTSPIAMESQQQPPPHQPHPRSSNTKRKRQDDGSHSDTPLKDRSKTFSTKRASLSLSTGQAMSPQPPPSSLPIQRRQLPHFTKKTSAESPPSPLRSLANLQRQPAATSPTDGVPPSRYGLEAAGRLKGRNYSAGITVGLQTMNIAGHPLPAQPVPSSTRRSVTTGTQFGPPLALLGGADSSSACSVPSVIPTARLTGPLQ